MSKELLSELIEKRDEYNKYIAELQGLNGNHEIETLSTVFDRVDKMPKQIRYETGISWFDRRLNGGFTEGTFINVAGQNFAGKTTFVLNILENISKYKQVLFFSFEMYERLIRNRLKHFDDVQASNFLIEQKRNDLDAIESIIRANSDNGIKFIAIDSRMKINVSGKKEEFQKNSEISARLSKLCQELGVIIILINQIAEGDLRSGRLGLKGSGDQAYDSDMMLFMLVNEETDERTMICEKDRINEKRWREVMPKMGGDGCVTTQYQMEGQSVL